PDDRRSSFLALTAKGRKIYSGFSAEWRGFEQEFDRLFSPNERNALHEGLERLAAQCLDHMDGN
ncbi:MAG: hypothetical protein ABW136_03605, partial [Steroidobacteraceae bacterium]